MNFARPPRSGDVPLRVALATDSREPSGVGEHMLTLAAAMARADGINIRLIADSATGLPDRARSLGFDAAPLGDGLPPGLDIVHIHAGIGWEGHGLAAAARRAGARAVVRTEHLPWLITDAGQRADYARAVRDVDLIIAVSQGAAESHREAGLARCPIRAVDNGIIETPPRHPRSRTRREFDPGCRPILLTAGRFTEQKGHADLIAAMGLLARDLDALLLIAGEGPLFDDVARDIEQRGLEASVRLLGRRSDLADLLAAADLFVLPSLFEGLPLVLLEAMAAGLPAVVTQVCGNEDAVVDGVTGWLAPPSDAAALAATIARALSDPAALAAAGRAARCRFEARYTAPRMAEETLALYRTALAREPAFA